MRFRANKFVLSNLVDLVAPIVPARDIEPVLKNFHVLIRDGELQMLATDLSLSILARSSLLDVQEEGEAVIPADKFKHVIKTAEDTLIDVEVTATDTLISAGRTNWSLSLPLEADFPPFPDYKQVRFEPVNRERFHKALMMVRPAVSDDMNRPDLSVVDVSGGVVRATDGSRYHQCEVDIEQSFQLSLSAVTELIRRLRVAEDEVIGIGVARPVGDVDADVSHVVLSIGQDIFAAVLPYATFPDVQRLLIDPAKDNDQELQVDRKKLQASVSRTQITADKYTSLMSIALDTNRAVLACENRFLDSSQDQIDVRWGYGQRSVYVNWDNLDSTVGVLSEPVVSIKFGHDVASQQSPLWIEEPTSKFLAIVHQLRPETKNPVDGESLVKEVEGAAAHTTVSL